MSEIINMHEDYSWIKKLVLNSDMDKFKVAMEEEDYNFKAMKIKLEVCGVEVQSEDFNKVIGKWADEIKRNAREGHINCDSIERFDGDVLQAAEELLEKRMKGVYDALQRLEYETGELLEEK